MVLAGAVAVVVLWTGPGPEPPGGGTGADRPPAPTPEPPPPTATTAPSGDPGPATAEAGPRPGVFYVGPDGDDGADGTTPETAFRTLEHAFAHLQPGRTLYLLGGEYRLAHPGPEHLELRVDGDPDNWTRILAAPGEQPVLVATQGTAIDVIGSYVEISGLTIRGEGFSESNRYGYGILVKDGHHFRLTHNRVYGMPVGGIVAARSSHLYIAGNVIHDNARWGPEQGSGISTWVPTDHGHGPDGHGYTDYIVGNVLYRNENLVPPAGQAQVTDGNGIIVDFGRENGYSGRFLIANNVIFDNGGRAVLVLESDRVDIVHNTTFHNSRSANLRGSGGEIVAARADDVRILNNLTWPRQGRPALAATNASNVRAEANVVVDGEVFGLPEGAARHVGGDGVVANPATDPEVADFRPVEGSPVVDAAVDFASPVTVDHDGRPRPHGAAGDVGAHELAAGDAQPAALGADGWRWTSAAPSRPGPAARTVSAGWCGARSWPCSHPSDRSPVPPRRPTPVAT
jgi:hypothetical protein